VFPKPNKNPHRLLIELSKTKKTFESQSLIIENDGRHNYTDNYKKLTREFYTIFN
jgi:tRNA1Val (adenine37-N6)-methyltransferase